MTAPATKTVLMVPSRELGWSEVRTALQTLPGVRLVEAGSLGEAVAAAADARPSVAIVTSELGEVPGSTLVRELRRVLPVASSILVVAGYFSTGELVTLALEGSTGYLLWDDLSLDLLGHCMSLAVFGPFIITSRSVGDAFPGSERPRGPLAGDASVVTDRERDMLLLLGQGMTQKEIATSENLSQRTVRRRIDCLRTKLAAPNLFTLGMSAVRLRLLP